MPSNFNNIRLNIIAEVCNIIGRYILYQKYMECEEPLENELNSKPLRRKRNLKPTVAMICDEVQLSELSFRRFMESYWDQEVMMPQDWPNGLQWTDISARSSLENLFEKLSNMIRSKRKFKINWSNQQINLLFKLAAIYAGFVKLSHLFHIPSQGWKIISACVPGRSSQDCFYKFLSFYKKLVRDYPWTDVEDIILEKLVGNPISTDWTDVSKLLYQLNTSTDKVYRSGKQCRQHFYCHLTEGLKKGSWTKKEDDMLLKLYQKMGNRWFEISKRIEGRNENSIKNRFAVLCKQGVGCKEQKRKGHKTAFFKKEEDEDSQSEVVDRPVNRKNYTYSQKKDEEQDQEQKQKKKIELESLRSDEHRLSIISLLTQFHSFSISLSNSDVYIQHKNDLDIMQFLGIFDYEIVSPFI